MPTQPLSKNLHVKTKELDPPMQLIQGADKGIKIILVDSGVNLAERQLIRRLIHHPHYA